MLIIRIFFWCVSISIVVFVTLSSSISFSEILSLCMCLSPGSCPCPCLFLTLCLSHDPCLSLFQPCLSRCFSVFFSLISDCCWNLQDLIIPSVYSKSREPRVQRKNLEEGHEYSSTCSCIPGGRKKIKIQIFGVRIWSRDKLEKGNLLTYSDLFRVSPIY